MGAHRHAGGLWLHRGLREGPSADTVSPDAGPVHCPRGGRPRAAAGLPGALQGACGLRTRQVSIPPPRAPRSPHPLTPVPQGRPGPRCRPAPHQARCQPAGQRLGRGGRPAPRQAPCQGGQCCVPWSCHHAPQPHHCVPQPCHCIPLLHPSSLHCPASRCAPRCLLDVPCHIPLDMTPAVVSPRTSLCPSRAVVTPGSPCDPPHPSRPHTVSPHCPPARPRVPAVLCPSVSLQPSVPTVRTLSPLPPRVPAAWCPHVPR